MERNSKYRCQRIHCKDLNILSGSISDIVNFSSPSSFAEKLLNAEQKNKLISEIKSLSTDVVLHKTIEANTEREEHGKVYVFEVKVCWEKNQLCVTEQVLAF